MESKKNKPKDVKKIPIGCNIFHYIKIVGKDKVCMYCGKIIKSQL